MTVRRKVVLRALMVATLATIALATAPSAGATTNGGCTDLCWYSCNYATLCETQGGGCVTGACLYPGTSGPCAPYAEVLCAFVE